ncbi:MAG: hypothetical protein KAS32_08410, partial [Candidatus Peribacteraceae bacterium]|nr:hypothetical protein [Candidatus Peribacteraceae bacterium]
VNIDENKPGCGFGKSKGSSYHEKCVTESECFANVDVKDKNGMPVSNALVTFGGCSIGETDYSGFTSSPIPCMIGEVSIQKQGYSEHKKLVKSGDMSSYSVVMESGGKKIPVHFYGVPLKRGKSVAIGEYKDYTVESQPRSISLFPGNYFVLVYLEHDNGEKIMLYNIGSDGFTGSSEAFIEPGFYSTFAAAVSKEYEITVGYIDSKYLSSGDEDKLYVYVPFVEGQTADSIKSTETSKIQATLNKCGIKAVSSSEQIVNIPCG